MDTTLSIASVRQKEYEVERLFEDMTDSEAPERLQSVLAVKNARDRSLLLRSLFQKWAELDGPSAYAAADSIDGRERFDSLAATFSGWAKSDLSTAWDEAKHFVAGASPQMGQAARGVMTEMAKSDLESLLAFVGPDSNNGRTWGFSSAIIDAMLEVNRPHELLQRIDMIEGAEEQGKWVSQLFQRWGSLDTGAALGLLEQIDDPQRAQQAMQGFLLGWVETDRDGALTYVFDNLSDPSVERSFGEILNRSFTWGSASQNSSLTGRIGESDLLDKYAADIISAVAAQQPETALQLANRVSDPDARIDAQRRAFSVLARADIDAAIENFKLLPSAESKSQMLPNIVFSIFHSSTGGESLTELINAIPAGTERTGAVEHLVSIASSNKRLKLSPEYLDALKLIAEAEPDLSERGRSKAAKLTGK